jgi:hypothetical protein
LKFDERIKISTNVFGLFYRFDRLERWRKAPAPGERSHIKQNQISRRSLFFLQDQDLRNNNYSRNTATPHIDCKYDRCKSASGLMAPHIGRRLVSSMHENLLPVAALMGGLLLSGADLLSRTLFSPTELPCGLLTATLGAPYFIYLLYHRASKKTQR